MAVLKVEMRVLTKVVKRVVMMVEMMALSSVARKAA